jgi:hypothetical protein
VSAALASPAPHSAAPQPHVYGSLLLQRSGARPLRLAGRLVACADDSARPAWARIRLALYACDDGDYAGEVRCESLQHAVRPWSDAWRGATLDEAVRGFEAAAPALVEGAADPSSCAAQALFDAAARAAREDAALRAFRHAVGNFLFELCQAGASEV